MTYEKIKHGLLIGFIGVILALLVLTLFIPISTIFLALVLGLLIALPVWALVLILIAGASSIFEKINKNTNTKVTLLMKTTG